MKLLTVHKKAIHSGQFVAFFERTRLDRRAIGLLEIGIKGE